MATLTAQRATDMLYVPEIDNFAEFNLQLESHPAYTLSPKNGGTFRIEMKYEVGQDLISDYTYTDHNGFWYGAFGFKVTLAQINDITTTGTGFDLRALQFVGADSISGSQFDDRLLGFNGNDTISGGNGSDDLNGNLGEDLVLGGLGADFVRGGQGGDFVDGEDGDDWHVNGNIGNDTVIGGRGNDTVLGGQGNDAVSGTQGNDLVYGDQGHDDLFGAEGDDTLTGGQGIDWFIFFGNDGDDVIMDFIPGPFSGEQIHLSASANGVFIPDFAAILQRATQTPDGTLIDIGAGHTIFLDGVIKNDLTAENFFFGT